MIEFSGLAATTRVFITQETSIATLVIAIVAAAATLVLVIVTWRYAVSTASIARETTRAANAARDTADLTILQSLLNVQPLLDIAEVEVDFLAGPAEVPFRISWKLTNRGSGTAYAPS